jgi:hypothetical protein
MIRLRDIVRLLLCFMVLVFLWSPQNLPDFYQLSLLSDLKAMQRPACWPASLTMAYQRARAGGLACVTAPRALVIDFTRSFGGRNGKG